MEQVKKIIPWNLSSLESASNARLDESDMGELYLLSFSHIGSSHIEDNKPNQDCFNSQVDLDTAYVAVGDGLGSYPFSNEGSELATRRITEIMKNSVTKFRTQIKETTGYQILLEIWIFLLAKKTKKIEEIKLSLEEIFEDKFKELITSSIIEIRNEIIELATNKKQSLEDENHYTIGDFATTCLFTMTDGQTALCAQVGDGGIFLICESESKLILKPSKGNSISETIPITYDRWDEYLKIEFLEIPKDAIFLCLMTDGFADSIHNPNEFFQEILENIRNKTKSEFKMWLTELNEFFESRGYSDDDKTVSFIFFKNDLFKESIQ